MAPPATAATPRRKRRATTEVTGLLIEAATEEFKRFGYASATTASIARRAGATEAQLFRYFGSKADLFRESVFNQLDRHFAEFNAQHLVEDAAIDDVRTLARLYITELQRFLSQHSELMLSLFVAQTYGPEVSPGVHEIASLQAYFRRGTALVENTVAVGSRRIDARLLVRISFAAVLANVMFKGWLFPPGLASESEIGDAVIDFVIDGIGVNASA